METSEKIKAARKSLGLTQAELAQRAGVSLMSIRRYEKGEKKYQLDILGKISSALGVSLSEMVSPDELFDLQMFSDLQQEAAERYLQEIIQTLGYQFGLDGRTGTPWMEDSDGNRYAIAQDKLDRFTNSIMDYLTFQLHELVKSTKADSSGS